MKKYLQKKKADQKNFLTRHTEKKNLSQIKENYLIRLESYTIFKNSDFSVAVALICCLFFTRGNVADEL